MKKKTYIICILGVLTLLTTLYCCSGTSGETVPRNSAGVKRVNEKDMPLNLSVYIDMSDRIIKNNGAVPQMDNDTALINYIFEIFLNRCRTNIISREDHFQILFYPQPSQSNINTIAKSLNLDLSKVEYSKKKKTIIDFQNTYQDNLSSIYRRTIDSGKWIGSDIWGFFSNKKVDQTCIRTGYRNVLIILTDGYLYHAANKIKESNAYSYILPQTLTNPSSSLIVKRDGLENLEVLVLEVNPSTPQQYERIEKILTDWFKGMGIKRISINETDLEANIEPIIANFLK